MEKDLEFDALFWRHAQAIRRELERFRPDVIHITGPSELGMFGAYFAWEMGVPLAASWHTNLHEYAARRMGWLTGWLGEPWGGVEDRGGGWGAVGDIAVLQAGEGAVRSEPGAVRDARRRRRDGRAT